MLEIHRDQIDRYGGSRGLRSAELLASAVAVPRAGVEGAYLHQDLADMASALLFHLVKNHPFVDGNKRVGLAAASVFVELNGGHLDVRPDEAVATVVGVAEGHVSKQELSKRVRSWMRSSA